MSSRTPGITGVILAGGRGTRMGGLEKGLLEWHGRPLIAHLIEALTPQVDHVLINANRSLDRYAEFGLPVVKDQPCCADQGPLSGLHAALSAAPTDLVVCIPCDLPTLPDDLVARLWTAARGRTLPIAMAATGARWHPTFCLVHRDYREKIESSLSAGHRASGRWFTEMGTGIADFGESSLLACNINTPEDLERLRVAANAAASPR